jgi:cob(I)alamin adenosyltransferase
MAEALGSLDEANSYLGICKQKSSGPTVFDVNGLPFNNICHEVQKNLFIVQAEIAGAEKTIDESKVKDVELLVDAIESELPPIKTFFIPGATDMGAHFDFARTLIRRAERRVVKVKDEELAKVGEQTLAYLNRLSSLLYALARLSNHKSGIKEDAPDYK